MRRCDSSNADLQERAQNLRQKLRDLKLQTSPTSDCSDQHLVTDNSNVLVGNLNAPLLPHTSSNNGFIDHDAISPPKISDKLPIVLDPSNAVEEPNCGGNSVNESISRCHHNIMKKLFPNSPPEQNISSPTDSPPWNDPPYHSENSVVSSSYENREIDLPDEITNDFTNPLTVLQSNHRLKYKFNTKYELDYGNNVLRGRNSLTKPLTLYNPSLLRTIHRKLSENNHSSQLIDSYEAMPMLRDKKLVCLFENGLQNRSSIHENNSTSVPNNEHVDVVNASSNNNIKSILKKSNNKSMKTLTFSIDVQYYDAICTGDLENVAKLAPMMDDFSKRTARGKTPLHLAVESGDINVVDYFIEKGLDVNAQDIRGQTPLHIATYNNYLNIIKFLLENGASPYIFSDFLDGFPSMVINEFLPNAVDCINIFEEYNKNLGTINNGIVYPICDWAGDLHSDLPLKEMSAIVITERNDMLVAKKWKAVDKHAKKGYIPWQIITVLATCQN